MTYVSDVLRELVASLRSQRVASAVNLLVVAGATAILLVTAGRSAGAEHAVLSRIDHAGTRSLTVYAQGPQPDFTSAVVAQLAGYDVVDAVAGFGPVQDVTTAASPQGPRVGLRSAYGQVGSESTAGYAPAAGMPQGWVSARAAAALGLPQRRGTLRVDGGREVLVTRTVDPPDYLEDLEPAVLLPQDAETGAPLAVLVVVADTPQDLPLVTSLIASALADVPRDGLKIETSQTLADLREVVGGELRAQSRGITVATLAGSTALVLMTVWSLVLMRRRDFGRRRALGATRTMIVLLMVGQVFIVSLAGAALGALAGLGLLSHGDLPLPAAQYLVAATGGFALAAAAVTVIPAQWAAYRDPLVELRVP